MGNNRQKAPHTVEFAENVVLLGHGNVASGHIQRLIDSNAPLVCADGGAHTALNNGLTPDIIIGDLDSFQNQFDGRVIHLTEQDTTDFEKCLYTVKAPLYIGYGFLGGRIDHELATLSTLVRYPEKSVILVGEQDICFCCPDHLEVATPIGTRVSIFPMSHTKMCSTGLEWPLNGLELSPAMRVATSNKASSDTISLTIIQGDALVILPVDQLSAVKQALTGR